MEKQHLLLIGFFLLTITFSQSTFNNTDGSYLTFTSNKSIEVYNNSTENALLQLYLTITELNSTLNFSSTPPDMFVVGSLPKFVSIYQVIPAKTRKLVGYLYNSDISFIVDWYMIHNVDFDENKFIINEVDVIKSSIYNVTVTNNHTSDITMRMDINFDISHLIVYTYPQSIVKFVRKILSYPNVSLVFVVPPSIKDVTIFALNRTLPYSNPYFNVSTDYVLGNVSATPDNFTYALPFTGYANARYHNTSSSNCAIFSMINGNVVVARSGSVSYINQTTRNIYIYNYVDHTIATYQYLNGEINVTLDQYVNEGDVLVIGATDLSFCITKASNDILYALNLTNGYETAYFDILDIEFYNLENPQGFFINYTDPKNISGYIIRGFETIPSSTTSFSVDITTSSEVEITTTSSEVVISTSNDIVTSDQCVNCPDSISDENTKVVINSSANFKDIELKNSTVDINKATIFISGDAQFTDTKLLISSSSILINGSLTIDNVPITMSLDSSIHLNGCININQSSDLIIDVKDFKPTDGEEYTLIDSPCINGEFATVIVEGENLDPCVKIKQQYTDTQFNIIFVTSNCNMQDNYSFLLWLVPICIGIPIVLIIVSVVIVCWRTKEKEKEMKNMIEKVGTQIQLQSKTIAPSTSSRSLERVNAS